MKNLASTLKMEVIYSSEISVNFQWTMSVIIEKTKLFVTTDVRISNLINYFLFNESFHLRLASTARMSSRNTFIYISPLCFP
jgi:hypothetical protein